MGQYEWVTRCVAKINSAIDPPSADDCGEVICTSGGWCFDHDGILTAIRSAENLSGIAGGRRA